MNKSEIVEKICSYGIIAIVRAENAEKAFKIARACAESGISDVEVTFTVPGAEDVIKELSKKKFTSEVLIGAGTVLDPETARLAISAGAKYIISPSLNTDTAKFCNRYQVPYVPGAMTVKEVVECLEVGVDLVKVFPAELFGPAIIKAIKGPLPQARLVATGGVNIDNVGDWIKAGSSAVGIGTNLTKYAKEGNYEALVNVGKEYVNKIRIARGG